MSQNGPVLGEFAPQGSARDAIHVPVVPIVAGEDMAPGDHFRVVQGVAYLADPRGQDSVGYVDPLLRRAGIAQVLAGQRFWGCVYPGTITSLRHSWQHPAFRPKPPEALP